MHLNSLKHSVRWSLVAICLCTVLETATATAGSFTRGCAARDLQILMLIEEAENSSNVPTAKLSDAMLALLEARIVCHEGYVMDAMAIYDAIARSITPDSFQSARQ
jgi:hypothetical protein